MNRTQRAGASVGDRRCMLAMWENVLHTYMYVVLPSPATRAVQLNTVE